MRDHFDRLLLASGPPTPQQFLDPEAFLYMSYWYAATYVIIEGWRELSLHDPEIDALLQSSNVDLLRRYRHGVFHFQAQYFDERFEGFIGRKDSPIWIRKLRAALSRYFLDWFKTVEDHQTPNVGESVDP